MRRALFCIVATAVCATRAMADYPPFEFIICNLPDGTTSVPITITAQPKFGRVCIAGLVTDALSRYLDIDTEGSANDLAIALYDNAGTLLARDDNSGDGSNAQLTFGLGRSAGVGTGAQYDGRDGEVFEAGAYWIAVAPGGSSFGAGFAVAPGPAVSGGSSVIRIRTNLNAGGSLLPPVPPVINHRDFTALGPAWIFPADDTLQGSTGSAIPNPNGDDSNAVLWSKFEIVAPGADASHYLDVDFGPNAQTDNIAYLFDAQGGLVAYSDDQYPVPQHWDPLPLLSFGSPAPTRSGPGNTVSFAGQNGPLAPGTYYLAYAHWPSDVLTGQGGNAPTLGPGKRWHVRGLSNNTSSLAAHFYTGTARSCDSIDFNNDSLFPDTLDIDDFLSVFSGGPCSNDPFCGDIDYTNDTLVPDTGDIDALLNVFAGGACVAR